MTFLNPTNLTPPPWPANDDCRERVAPVRPTTIERHYAKQARLIDGDLRAIKHGVVWGLLSIALLWLIMNGPELVEWLS